MRPDAESNPCNFGGYISYGDGERFGNGDGDGDGDGESSDGKGGGWGIGPALAYSDDSGGNGSGDGHGDADENVALFNPCPGNFTAEVTYANIFGAQP